MLEATNPEARCGWQKALGVTTLLLLLQLRLY